MRASESSVSRNRRAASSIRRRLRYLSGDSPSVPLNRLVSVARDRLALLSQLVKRPRTAELLVQRGHRSGHGEIPVQRRPGRREVGGEP